MASILKINNPTTKTYKILLAPLDWGLGHATRCIPIIKELLINKYEVCVAATGDQKALLEVEFPFLSFVELPGYQIKYDKNRAFTVLRLLGSIPKILIRIKKENRWLRRLQEKERVDMVISDNRYGLWHRGIYCVLITHQLNIQSGMGAWVNNWIRRWHYRLIEKFNACWVPDMPGGMGLAGQLSHPVQLPDVPTRYVGLLSRMERSRPENDEPIDLLILLSGPEPQRSILEKLLWDQLRSFHGTFVLVRGLPRGGTPLKAVNVYDHLSSRALNELLLRAGMVVARSGYSTVMDLVRLQKRSILIPTPGQTEQEYLGNYLTAQRIALCVRQRDFSLLDALLQAERFAYVTPQEDENLLKDILAQSFSSVRLG